MKFATPLTVALFVTSRIGSEADAAGTTGDGLVNSAVGWNEKVRGYTSMSAVESEFFHKELLLLLYHFLFLYIYLSTQLLDLDYYSRSIIQHQHSL